MAAYLSTVAVELPVLLVGLHRRHSLRDRVFCGLWLSAATLPVVWHVLPSLFSARLPYLVVAETFAPVAEIGLFLGALAVAGVNPWTTAWRDGIVIAVANLLSFGLGMLVSS